MNTMLGRREYKEATCFVRMMTDMPMQFRDSLRLIHDLKTAKGMQGRGQGTTLMNLLCEEADQEQKILMLMPDSDKLEKWYNKFGFERTQENPVIMVRNPK